MQDIDWSSLGFAYMPTRSHICYTWKDGVWSQGVLIEGDTIKMSIAASCLHYGQEAFEGMKAFRCKDDKVRIFRPEANAERLYRTALRTCMPPVPVDMFLDAVKRVIRDNEDYVPPYGTGGSLYIRPLLIGSGAQIGVSPSSEYTFIVMVMPVGNYYKGGIKPVRALILDKYDRAAPQGMGDVKVGGNYAASFCAQALAKKQGFSVELYLDAREHKYVDEFTTSNFIGIKADGSFITVDSSSVLPSVTNMSLQQIAKDLGMKVEVRAIPYTELSDFVEVGACGTAVVVTPVSEIVRGDECIEVGPKDECGPVLLKLYREVQAIQYGEKPDVHGWCISIDA